MATALLEVTRARPGGRKLMENHLAHEAFHFRSGVLACGDHPLDEIARSVSTPFYVYSATCLVNRFRRLDRAFSPVPHLVCYALKANSQPALLQYLVDEGAGAEVVSGAELALALRLRFPSDRIVFSGVGKTESELAAGLRARILLFVVESEGELSRLDHMAGQMGTEAHVAIRINPDIDPKTHPHMATGVQTAKFGLDPKTALGIYERRDAFRHLRLDALHTHIGSQISSIEPLVETARAMQGLVGTLQSQGLSLTHLDLGGGLGIDYDQSGAPSLEEYARGLLSFVGKRGLHLIVEPGRSLVGPAGALVVRVLYVKEVHGRRHAVVDSGMTDLLRPALYGAYHRIVPVSPRDGDEGDVDIVGAVCEAADVLGRARRLGEIRPGDLLAVLDTGAYGYSMSSNYNLRPRPAEVLVEGETYRLVRRAETVEDLVERELGHAPRV